MRDSQAASGRWEETGVLLLMTWGWSVDGEKGTRGFAKGGRRVLIGAFKKGEWDICLVYSERRDVTTINTAVLEDIRFYSEWNMHWLVYSKIDERPLLRCY